LAPKKFYHRWLANKVRIAATIAFLLMLTGQALRGEPARSDWTAPPSTSWPTNGGDWSNRRYSPLSQINRANVSGLKAVWRMRLGSGDGAIHSGEAQPIFADGVLYIITGANDVFAIDVDTGTKLWAYKANLDTSINTVCCGWTSRGVALGAGRIYVGQLDGKLVALDQKTGAVVWSTQAASWQNGYTITTAPLFYGDLVVTGFAGAEFGTRGMVKAFRASDGSPAWTFYTVPGPGETGHETWPADTADWKRGGGSVWQTPAYDPKLGLLYFSTGNAGPDFNGGGRKGDNLFTSSIVAVDARTGKYRWHYQQVHHDIWDFDAPNPVVLFDLNTAKGPRKALAQAGKTGWVYILDRVSGQPLLPIPERPVPQELRQNTSPTQPMPEGDMFVPDGVSSAPDGVSIVNGGRIFTPFWKNPVAMRPGAGGGANWPPSALDVKTNILYICATDRVSIYKGGDDVADTPPGGLYTGGPFGSVIASTRGIFVAMNMRTNRIVWQQSWPDRCYSGSAVTAGGLVFAGRNDGRFTAMDSKTGATLWSFQTGAGVNAPSSVFRHRGKQYVAVYSAGNAFVSSPRGDSVWLFALHGKLGPVPAAIEKAVVAGAPVSAAKGKALFADNCSMCHGSTGLGGAGGPNLSKVVEPASVNRVVSGGRGQMPAFASRLNETEIRDVSAYVTTLAGH
jgi:quinohemoprotein ethanol dehydrogenase